MHITLTPHHHYSKAFKKIYSKKLGIQRIALLMFKYIMGVAPHPITDLFALNNERHNYNIRQTHDLQINAGRGEIVYKLFSFHGVHIWNHNPYNNNNNNNLYSHK